MIPGKLIVTVIAVLNVLAYLLMCFDKYQAKHGGRRIPENTLFLLALVFGAAGIYAGMKAPLYHKTGKTKFRIGIPLLFVLNVLAVCFLVA